MPYLGLERDQNLRPDSSVEKLAKLKPVFGGPDGTMTAGNSTPLSDGASAVLLASEEWAKAHDIPVQAYFTDAQTAGVDYVHKREGLLMAPAYAMPRMLARNGADPAGLRLLRDPRGVRRPGAVHAEGVGGPGVLLASASASTSRSGAIDRERLNVHGGSLGAGHPFGATGGRIVAALAKALSETTAVRGRGVISICAAGGLGVTAIMEAAP